MLVGVLAMLACCAAPLLIASGGLAAAAGVLRELWPLAVAAVLLAVAVGWTVWRHRHHIHLPDSSHSTNGTRDTRRQ